MRRRTSFDDLFLQSAPTKANSFDIINQHWWGENEWIYGWMNGMEWMNEWIEWMNEWNESSFSAFISRTHPPTGFPAY
jgi:hypothetical protein